MDTKLLDRIKKLYDKANDPSVTQEEAAAFAAKVHELLAKHKIDMSEVEFHSQKDSDPIKAQWIETSPNDPKQRARKWRWNLCAAISEAHFCKLLVVRNSSRAILIGRGFDREIAVYMIRQLTQTAETMADKAMDEYKVHCWHRQMEPNRQFRENFLHGFAAMISYRYVEEKKHRDRQYFSNGTALIRFRKEEQAVKDMAKDMTNPSWRIGKQKDRSQGVGFIHGVNAAVEADIRQGLNVVTDKGQIGGVS